MRGELLAIAFQHVQPLGRFRSIEYHDFALGLARADGKTPDDQRPLSVPVDEDLDRAVAEQGAKSFLLTAISAKEREGAAAFLGKYALRTDRRSQIFETLAYKLPKTDLPASGVGGVQYEQRLGHCHLDCREMMDTSAAPAVDLG